MKAIKIHINDLGLIRNSNIEITPLMVFSGESGLGKSYVAILCHYFFHVWLNPKRLDVFFKEIASSNRGLDFFRQNQQLPDKGIAIEISKFELERWLAKDAISYLAYMIGNDNLKADITLSLPDSIPNQIPFTFEQEIVGLDNEVEIYTKLNVLHISYKFKQLGINEESPYSYTLRHAIIQELFGSFDKLNYAFVLPPSRGSYMSEEVIGKTGLYKSFIEGMRVLDQAQEIPVSTSKNLIELFQDVLDGVVKKGGENYVYVTRGEEMPISAAASSVREIAPLQLMFKKRDISKASVLIEEPESHLHPLKQRLMADIIATMALAGANMQITTHSDFFMRRINDLLRLHILKTKLTPQEFSNFCSDNQFREDLTIEPGLLSAYFLERQEQTDFVFVRKQDAEHGIPFDTFKQINGKPMNDSAMLYDLTTD